MFLLPHQPPAATADRKLQETRASLIKLSCTAWPLLAAKSAKYSKARPPLMMPPPHPSFQTSFEECCLTAPAVALGASSGLGYGSRITNERLVYEISLLIATRRVKGSQVPPLSVSTI